MNQSTHTDVLSIGIPKAHQDMVRGLAKPGEEILKTLSPGMVHAWHMSTGMAGEAGEILDFVKKLAIYNKPLDEKARDKLIEELGDLEFYIEGLRQAFGFSREFILAENIRKLGKRYKDHKYSDQQAIDRKDQA